MRMKYVQARSGTWVGMADDERNFVRHCTATMKADRYVQFRSFRDVQDSQLARCVVPCCWPTLVRASRRSQPIMMSAFQISVYLFFICYLLFLGIRCKTCEQHIKNHSSVEKTVNLHSDRFRVTCRLVYASGSYSPPGMSCNISS